ncbi:MAG: glycosyltransferase family 39 protein [Saprospiraceae bacterium]
MHKSFPWPYIMIAGIVILFLIRMENIDEAPMDTHFFRQALTLGVARNYIEWDSNLFHPRTILCDSREGNIAGEFPIYNYLVSILWRIFGQHNWCFRLLTLIVSSFGLWYFYKISCRIISEKSSVAATVLFGTSIAFIYARKGMPDVFSLSLVLAGVSFGWSFLEKGKFWQLLLFILFVSTGILSKIPSATVAVFLAWPILFDKAFSFKRKMWLIAASVIALLPVVAWYFVWVPIAEKEFSQNFFFRLGLSNAWYQIAIKSWNYTLERFYPIALQSRLSYIFLILGFGLMFIKRNYKFQFTFLMISIIFLIFILQVGEVFSAHEYYIIPYVPIMALIAGYGLGEVVTKDWLFILILIVLGGEAIYRKHDDFFVKEEDKRITKIENVVRQCIPFNSRIMVVGQPVYVPSMMYFAHRKGWPETNLDQVYNRDRIVGESTVGLEYIVADRLIMPDTIDYPMLYEDNEFRIFKIKGAIK